MQAITTKYHGPSEKRGSRITARAQGKRIIVAWDDALGVDANHDQAARALASKLGWNGSWCGGGLPDGTGNVYVCVRTGDWCFEVQS